MSTTGQLAEVKEGLGLAFLEKMVSRDELWITATVSIYPSQVPANAQKLICACMPAESSFVNMTEVVLHRPCLCIPELLPLSL